MFLRLELLLSHTETQHMWKLDDGEMDGETGSLGKIVHFPECSPH